MTPKKPLIPFPVVIIKAILILRIDNIVLQSSQSCLLPNNLHLHVQQVPPMIKMCFKEANCARIVWQLKDNLIIDIILNWISCHKKIKFGNRNMSSTISWHLKGFNWFLIGSYTKKLKDVVLLIAKQEMTHFEQFPKVNKKTKQKIEAFSRNG